MAVGLCAINLKLGFEIGLKEELSGGHFDYDD